MVATIARKEALELLRDGRLRWAAATVAILLVASLAAGWQHYRDVNRQHAAAQAATRNDWLNQGSKNAHSAAHYGIYAFKPKLPLSFVDTGLDNYTGVSAWLEAHKQNEFKFRPAQDATALQRFGELTAASVLQLLVPLLIIVMSFAAFAGERETGTLKQLLSLGVPCRSLLAGKALGLSAALGFLLVPASLIGAAALVFGSDAASLGTTWPRTIWLAGSYLLYFGAFLGIALAVSAWTRSSRAALLALLAVWIVNGLVAPRVTAEIAKRAHPTPSAFEFASTMERALRFGLDGTETPAARDQALRREVLAKYGADSIDALPVSFAGLSLQAGEDHGNEVFDKLYGDLWDTYGRQHRVHELAGIVAPFLAVRSVSMGLAGTDFEQHRDFAVAAESYRRELVKVMNAEMRDHAGRQDFGYISTPETWARVPAFTYEAPPVSVVLARQRFSLAVLGAWCALACAAAWIAVSRLEVA
jgi:ABC-2 type transport system permease protein